VFLACWLPLAHGQGIISFDHYPIRPGQGVLVTNCSEDGFTFTPINSGEQFSLSGGGRLAFPENGSAYILQGAFTSLAATRNGSKVFGLHSVDLSEFSTLYDFPRTVQFVGYRSDGTVVTTDFTTDGLIDGTGPTPDFQAFHFDNRFSNLLRFEVPTDTYALDNLVYFIPEPSTGALMFVGLIIACNWRARLHRNR
jgi:hypothetical protein